MTGTSGKGTNHGYQGGNHGILWLWRMLMRANRPWPGCWPNYGKSRDLS